MTIQGIGRKMVWLHYRLGKEEARERGGPEERLGPGQGISNRRLLGFYLAHPDHIQVSLQLSGPQTWDFYWIFLFFFPPIVHSSVDPSDYFQTSESDIFFCLFCFPHLLQATSSLDCRTENPDWSLRFHAGCPPVCSEHGRTSYVKIRDGVRCPFALPYGA